MSRHVAEQLFGCILMGVTSIGIFNVSYELKQSMAIENLKGLLELKGFNSVRAATGHKFDTIKLVQKVSNGYTTNNMPNKDVDDALKQVMTLWEYDKLNVGNYVQNILRAQSAPNETISKKDLVWEVHSDPCPNGANHDKCTKTELFRALSHQLMKSMQ